MLLRMEHLFDEVENKLLIEVTKSAHNTNHNTDGTNNNTPSEILTLLNAPPDEIAGVDIKSRLPSKPVVIGDALPVPNQCPDTVEQLLEASLGHHNLGAFEEALKFLEAARIQLEEVVQSKCGHTIEHHVLQAKKHYNTHHAAHMNSTANNHRNPTEKAGTTSASTSTTHVNNNNPAALSVRPRYHYLGGAETDALRMSRRVHSDLVTRFWHRYATSLYRFPLTVSSRLSPASSTTSTILQHQQQIQQHRGIFNM
jgi:hypothetical protein